MASREHASGSMGIGREPCCGGAINAVDPTRGPRAQRRSRDLVGLREPAAHRHGSRADLHTRRHPWRVLSFTDSPVSAARSFNWVGPAGITSFLVTRSDRPSRNHATRLPLCGGDRHSDFSILFGLLVGLGLHGLMQLRARGVSAIFSCAPPYSSCPSQPPLGRQWPSSGRCCFIPISGLVNSMPGRRWHRRGGPRCVCRTRGLVTTYTLAVIGIWQTIGYNMVLSPSPVCLCDPAGISYVRRRSGWRRAVAGSGDFVDRWGLGPMPRADDPCVVTGRNGARAPSAFFSRPDRDAHAGGEGRPSPSDVLVYSIYREGFLGLLQRRGYFDAAITNWCPSSRCVVFFQPFVKFRFMESRVHYR